MTEIEPTYEMSWACSEMSKTSSERFMYVQITLCVLVEATMKFWLIFWEKY